jgi:hypothetical protein
LKWWTTAAADASPCAKVRGVCTALCAGPDVGAQGIQEARSIRALAVVYGAHTAVASALDCMLLLFAHVDLDFTPVELALLVAEVGLCTIAVETLPELVRQAPCTAKLGRCIARNPLLRFFGLADGDGVSALRAGGLSDSATIGGCSFMYRYILRESCSQFDSLPLTSLTTPALGIGFSLCQTAILAFAVAKWVLFLAAPLGALAVMVPRSIHLLVQKKTPALALPATLATLHSAHSAAACSSPAVIGALFTLSASLGYPTIPFLALTLVNIVAIIGTLAYYDGVWKEELMGPNVTGAGALAFAFACAVAAAGAAVDVDDDRATSPPNRPPVCLPTSFEANRRTHPPPPPAHPLSLTRTPPQSRPAPRTNDARRS